MSLPLVLVDDTNPNIQYSGPWFTAQNTQADTGNFGLPFQSTLHGVNVDASFSFSFSGTSITVLGTSITTNASGTQDPTWECFVDNNSIGWNTVLEFAENNWVFCQNGQLHDGPHVLTVKAKVSNQQTFWFDQIQYIPSSNVPLDQSILHVDSSDSTLQYSPGWQPLNGIVNLTQTAGSTLTYQFSGVSLSWVAFIPGRFPLSSSSATYSIDGQTPTTFLVPALSSAGATELYNQILFQTGKLSPGHHKLVVTYQGNSGTAPLALDYFAVQDAPSSSTPSSTPSSAPSAPSLAAPSLKPASAPSSSNTPTHAIVAGGASTISSSVPSSSSSGSSGSSPGSTGSSTTTNHTGAIVGGVIGGLVLLLLILFLFIRRRNNRGAKALNEKSDASGDMVDPFILPPSNLCPTPTSLSQNYTSNGQSLTSPTISCKFTHRSQLSDVPSTSSNVVSTFPPTDTSSLSGGAIPALTILRVRSSSSTMTSPSSTRLPYARSDSSMTKAREAETETAHLRPQLAPSRSADSRFLRHEDSGLRMPPAVDEVTELPPLYTPG
ncbi:hypothetical protein BYT27DRAFT_7245174 [Phlegmacium glaucopus]|nr:hypothetical protein BYT27DRAFT_7245174 [Phlegmacium glaucopus]